MPEKELEGALRHRVAPAALLVCLLGTCTHENVTQVVVGSVTVSPPTVSAFHGEEVTLAATVRDEQGQAVTGARVLWSSDDPSVAMVGDDGLARAVSVGSTTVRASFQGVSGSATVVVLRAPTLSVSRDSVAIYAGAGGGAPATARIEVTNEGGGVLDHLGVAVVYPPGAPNGWLEVGSDGSGIPTELILSARPEGLSIGSYQAALVLTAAGASNSPLTVPVTLALTGLRIGETGGGTAVTEAGGTDQFSVALAVQPPADVAVDIVSTDPGEVSVSPTRLHFTRATWAQPQIVTVGGVDDPTLDGEQTTDVRLVISGDDGVSVVQVTTEDDDVAELNVVEVGGGTVVTEAGTRDDLRVSLAAQPLTDVVLQVGSGDEGEAVVDPTTLRFEPASWNEPQTVAVTGVDDDVIDGDQVTRVTLVVDPSGSDEAFLSVPERQVAVTTRDLDVPGLAIVETGGGTTVTESGSRDGFSVALGAGPTSDVVLTVVAEDGSEVAVEPPTLRFTPGDWREPKAVLVRGIDDGEDDGDQVTFVRLAVDAATSNDAYDALAPTTVRVTTTDNDGYGVTVIETEGSTILTEGGGQDQISVVLDRAPWMSDVVVEITSADPGEVGVATPTLRFTASDWSTPRTVTLTGVADGVADGDQAVRITVAVNDAASDFFYRFVPDRSVIAVARDADGAGSSVGPGGAPK